MGSKGAPKKTKRESWREWKTFQKKKKEDASSDRDSFEC